MVKDEGQVPVLPVHRRSSQVPPPGQMVTLGLLLLHFTCGEATALLVKFLLVLQEIYDMFKTGGGLEGLDLVVFGINFQYAMETPCA